MLIVVKTQIKGVRKKQRIKELILGAIMGISLSNVCSDNVIFTFPERSLDQKKTKIQLIADRRAGEIIGAGEENQIKTVICLTLLPVVKDIQEGDITIRDFNAVFDEYC